MNSAATLDPAFVSALKEAVAVLRSVAESELEDDVVRRMRELGEKKEDCSREERDEHRQLADLWRRLTLRKTRALNALRRLGQMAPELIEDSPEPTHESPQAAVTEADEGEDILNWDNLIPVPPTRPGGRIRVKLKKLGRDKPIPAEDPWAK